MARLEETGKKSAKTRKDIIYRIVWHDATKEPDAHGRQLWMVRVEGGDHTEALKTAQVSAEEWHALVCPTNREQRKALLEAYEALEVVKFKEAERAKQAGVAPAHSTLATQFLDAYESLVDFRVSLSTGEKVDAATDLGWRMKPANTPMKPSTAKEVKRAIKRLRDSLPNGLTTGAMNGTHIAQCLASLRAGDAPLSAGTINNMRGYLAAMFGTLTNAATKRYFRADPNLWFRDEVEALREPHLEIITHGPSEIISFMEAAERAADPNRTMTVSRKKRRGKQASGKVEHFEQSVPTPPAPVLQWAMLLACTGVRRGEAETMRWSDVDLQHGVIRVFASKTNAMRYVPLIGDPAGDIAPGFVEVLKIWRQQRPNDIFVLPSANGTPCYPKHAWDAVNTATGTSITPQGLRRTFESMLAMVGIPASLAAFWLGHSVQVAESNYRAYRPGRLPGSTLEAALGLTPFLTREARGQAALRLLPKAVGDGAHGGDFTSSPRDDGGNRIAATRDKAPARGRGRSKQSGKKN